jgi:plastocyanin
MERAALYGVLSAAPGWFARRLRTTNYKLWMPSCLAMWLVTAGLGGYVYKRLNADAAVVHAQAPASTRITIKGFAFDPKKLTVPVGTEVEWMDESGRHSVVADDGSFKSEILTAGSTFKHKFDKKGTFRYYCEFHGEKGGKDMAGEVVVK